VAIEILDGKGSGKRAEVDKDNRLRVNAVSRTESEYESEQGNGYNVNTGDITLTSAAESYLLYIKNTGDNPIHISTVFYLWGSNTGGSGDCRATIWKNPTAGSLISSGTAVEMNQNRNFGSSNNLTADIYKGQTGETITTSDGKVIESIFNSTSPGRVAIYVGLIELPKNKSIAVSLSASAGTTSQTVQVACALHEYTFDT
jgi:urease beta subunit